MNKIGLSLCEKPMTAEMFENYKRNGIDFAEISPKYYEYKDLDYKNIKSCADSAGVTLWSFHLPFLPFEELDISSEDKDIRSNSVKYFTELIKKAADIGIDKYVVHPSAEPIAEDKRAERMNCSKESLASLAKTAKECGGTVAVEDLPRTCLGRSSADICELISADSSLMVCFDTNHLLGESASDFIKKVGKRIITTHVSDYDFLNERHWLPGEGKNDWNSIIDSLEEIGYDGVWLYELGFACPDSITRSRDLTCEDFARNAKELFNRQKLTVIGTPKPNLTSWK